MDALKGWKTIIVAVLMFVVAGLDALRTIPDIPGWVFGTLYPAIMLVLRFFTETPIMKKDATNNSNRN